MKNLICIAFILLFVQSVFSDDDRLQNPRIGVAVNEYDHVEKYLQKLKIPFTMIPYRELEFESTYSLYDAIFLPCGTEMPLTSSVNILTRGTHLEGVSLNEQHYKIDMKKTGANIKKFIDNGGSVYFTDFSYIYLQESLHPFSFYYKDFPFLGESGQIKAKVEGELSSYMTSPSINLYFDHSGWVMPAYIHNGESLLFAESETPIGIKQSSIASLIHYGDGIALYSSYHDINDPFSIMRYLIFRTIYSQLAERAQDTVSKWEQKQMSLVVDRNIPGENSRTYFMKVKKGANNLYFHAPSGKWLIDIFDQQGSLIFSRENVDNDFSQKIPRVHGDSVIVRVVPLETGKYYPYTVVTAAGIRFIPYFIHTSLGILAFAILFIYVVFIRKNKAIGRQQLPGLKE